MESSVLVYQRLGVGRGQQRGSFKKTTSRIQRQDKMKKEEANEIVLQP
jgi:hypothetical protein